MEPIRKAKSYLTKDSLYHKIHKAPLVAALAFLMMAPLHSAPGADRAKSGGAGWLRTQRVETTSQLKNVEDITPEDVDNVFTNQAVQLHRKMDLIRNAYRGYTFRIPKDSVPAIAAALGMKVETVERIYEAGDRMEGFVTSASAQKKPQFTASCMGLSLSPLRGKTLDKGLASVNDSNLAEMVQKNMDTVLKVAEAIPHLSLVYFPVEVFTDMLAEYGADLSPETFYDVANTYGYSAVAGDRRSVRGDFGMAVRFMLVAKAP